MSELQSKDQVKLRKISSMETSELFDSLETKKVDRSVDAPKIVIPSYPPARPYKRGTYRSLWARARYFLAILKQKLSGQEYPLIAVVVVNNHCNWNCTYCFGDYPSRRDTDYTTDELKFIIESLYKMGARYVNLHGGETLLRNDMGEVTNFAKNLGMYVCVITNGSLLHQKLDHVRNVDNLTISLDGRPENNDKVRGKGTYEKSMSAIRLAVSEKIPLRVSATLTRYTMHDIDYLAKLAHSEGFHLYFSILFKPLKQARDAQMTSDEIRAAVQEIRKYKAMGYPIFTSDPVLDATYHWPFDFNETHHATLKQLPQEYKTKHHVKCYYSRTKFTIEADGYIYPCFLTTDGSFKPKNWREVGLAEAIRHTQKTNTCKACPAMSQNDHSALLGLSWKQVKYVIGDQFKEALKLKNRIRDLN